MKSPFTGKEMSIRHEKRMLSFRKEEIEIDFHYYFCEDTGEKFESDELAEINQLQVLNKYRERLNLPFPEKIIEIRKKYGIPASTMSDILGFGVNTYRNYENGEVPSTANARLIQLIEDPKELIRIVNFSQCLDQKEKEKILRKAEQLAESKSSIYQNIEHWLLSTGNPNELNGYQMFNLEKTINMLTFFSEKMQPWKTIMNKLLFYSDFYNFKKGGNSISGLNYRAIPLGPVPAKFDSLFEYLADNQYLFIEYVPISNENTGEKFHPGSNSHFNPELFNPGEIEVMETVFAKFKEMSTQQIIELSHREKAWAENQKDRKIISYYYAFDMIND
jgi:putative zinc finger/helix-turn-helix YgiT family protein